MQMYKYTNIQIYKYTNIQVYKYIHILLALWIYTLYIDYTQHMHCRMQVLCITLIREEAPPRSTTDQPKYSISYQYCWDKGELPQRIFL